MACALPGTSETADGSIGRVTSKPASAITQSAIGGWVAPDGGCGGAPTDITRPPPSSSCETSVCPPRETPPISWWTLAGSGSRTTAWYWARVASPRHSSTCCSIWRARTFPCVTASWMSWKELASDQRVTLDRADAELQALDDRAASAAGCQSAGADGGSTSDSWRKGCILRSQRARNSRSSVPVPAIVGCWITRLAPAAWDGGLPVAQPGDSRSRPPM